MPEHTQQGFPTPLAFQPLWLTDTDWPADVAEFCRAHDLAGAVRRCIQLADAHLGLSRKPEMYLNHDPDTLERWVTVLVTSARPVQATSDAYESFVREWVRTTNRAERAQVRLSYTVESS